MASKHVEALRIETQLERQRSKVEKIERNLEDELRTLKALEALLAAEEGKQ